MSSLISIESFKQFCNDFRARAKKRDIRIVGIENSSTLTCPPRCSSKIGIQTDAVPETIALLSEMGYNESSHHIIYGRGHIVVVDLSVVKLEAEDAA